MMGITGYAILFLSLLAALAIASFININAIDKRIDEILAEEERQNKRIDILVKHEQMRRLQQRHDKAYVVPKDLFEKW